MRNVSKFLAASGLVMISLGLTACQNVGAPAAPQKAPEVVLQEAMNKLADVTSYSYDVNLVGNLKGPAGEKPEAVAFNVSLDGGIEMKDPKDPKLNIDVKGDMTADADGGTGEVAFKLNKDAIFLNLMSLTGKGSVTIPDALKTQYVGKWWTMPLPPAALDELAKAAPGGNAANMTDDHKKMKALVENTKFFKNVQYVGDEKVGNENSMHYTGVLDKDAFMSFITQASELQGNKMTDADQKDLKDSMDYIDLSAYTYVGKDSGVLNKLKGTLTLKENTTKPSPTGTVTFDATLSNLNQPVTVDAPKDAQPIPAEALSSLPL